VTLRSIYYSSLSCNILQSILPVEEGFSALTPKPLIIIEV